MPPDMLSAPPPAALAGGGLSQSALHAPLCGRASREVDAGRAVRRYIGAMKDAGAEAELTSEERLRCAAKVCVIFARNMAYYRAARIDGEMDTPFGNFWRTIDGNFIDTCVLEWCKIFGEKSAKHAWTKLVADAAEFEEALYDNIEKDAAAFAAEVIAIRRYRDKFLAHLDSDRTMLIPHLDTMWRAVQFYYAHILGVEMENQAADRVQRELGSDLVTYYNDCFAEARAVYEDN